MKNERRQKLTQNSLAHFLENGITQIKPHSTTIMRVIMIVLIFVLLFLLWWTFSSRNKLEFYNDIKHLNSYNAMYTDAEQFDKLISEYTTKYPSGANNAHVSLLIGNLYFTKADALRAEGKRDEAIAEYENALEYYTTADKFNLKQQELAENAAWGVAQTNEVLDALKEGDYLAVAIAQYERICDKWPDGVYTELATEQLRLLKRPIMSSFMTKYRNSSPALFAPDLQTPDIIGPDGEIDTTIIPGGFDSGLMLETPWDNETEIEYDPALTVTEPESDDTDNDADHDAGDDTEVTPETGETMQPGEESQDTEESTDEDAAE